MSLIVNRKKLPVPPRRLWRVTPETPMGAIVDFDPTSPGPLAAPPDVPAKVLDPAPVVDWRSSSYDLLNGLEVQDESDSIPGELFDKMFKR